MEPITLTKRDLLRLQTAQRVIDGVLSIAQAAADLAISTRTVKRLTRRLRIGGAGAFRSMRAGKPPNNAFDPAIRDLVLERARTTYAGFGPTLLAEKLAEREQIDVNRETLRQWLIRAKLYRARRRRQKPRPMRERRPRFGELVQADGSPHRWFEDRGGVCALMLCVDDATSSILGGLFAEHVLPMALYTDKHSIFRINLGTELDDETQVQRALRELEIESICANSPQAKGRVERANRSLQDRLVKEFRLAGIDSIDQANRFLPGFLLAFNRRFAVQPREPEDAHGTVDRESLKAVLTKQYARTITSNLTFQISDKIYAIDPSPLHRLRAGMRVTICLPRADEPFVLYKEQKLSARLVGRHQRTGNVVESKRLNDYLDRRLPNPKKGHKPAKAHPLERRIRSGAHRQSPGCEGTSLNCNQGTSPSCANT